MTELSLTFLGTGTSQGVPVIGCNCEVCSSDDLKDKRLRSSVLIQSPKANVVIDCGPDFRQQMLRVICNKLDAVVLTHEHMDHVAGLDDVRPFNFITRSDMPVYCTDRVLQRLKVQFSYAFAVDKYPGSPGFDPHLIKANEDFVIGDQSWKAILARHGTWPVMGYRINDVVYLTDVNGISDESMDHLIGAKVLIVSALRKEPHVAHYALSEAIAMAKKSKIPQVYFTHFSHLMGLHAIESKSLPKGMAFAHDGLKISFT